MFLLDALKRIFRSGEDEEEQHFYRVYGDYPTIIEPNLRSISPPRRAMPALDPPENHHSLSYPRPTPPSAPSFVDSIGNLKPPAVISHGDRTLTRNPVTNSSETTLAASRLSKSPFHSPSSSIRASAPPSTFPLSEKSSLDPVPSTNSKVSAARIPADREKLFVFPDTASISPSVRNTAAPLPSLKSFPSPKSSSASISSTNSSISGAPVNVCRGKLPVPLDSAIRSAEKPSSSSPSPKSPCPSPAPPSESLPVSISSANSSYLGDGVSLRWKKKTTSLSPSSIKVSSPNTTLDVSLPSPSPPLSTEKKSLEPRIRNRRVLPKYETPKHLEEMIKNDIVPPVIKRPLSPSTYADYFATLLYAEDFYIEKWSNYLLHGVPLDVLTSKNSQGISKKNMNYTDFVAFEIDSVPERRPYLLSRDFVFVQPLNEIAEPFKGRIFRVVKSSTVLVEFGDDFHSLHSPSKRYDVSFSFNRVCLKRAHQAISAAADPSLHNILFPDQCLVPYPYTIVLHENIKQFHLPVRTIVNHKGPLPYLIQGPPSVALQRRNSDQNGEEKCLSITGVVIHEAIIEIYRISPSCRILVCSPSNNTSDVLLRSLRKVIPEIKLFRANAAYRDYEHVPDDIIPASLYEEEEECFSCPPLADLLNFCVITSTFMSSFRLHAAGIDSEHFTHIFLVDASYAIEPEAVVPLANLAGKDTAIVVTGSSDKSPAWVRSDIARRYGLKQSYFHRLWKT